jgi:hypothetical protein
MNASAMVPVLFVTGPIGVGKTAVLHEADSLLLAEDVRHATVELEEIARCWTQATQHSRTSFVHQNLAALWSRFAAVGAERLLLSGLVEQRSDVQRVTEAVPGAEVTVVRLLEDVPCLPTGLFASARSAGVALGDLTVIAVDARA